MRIFPIFCSDFDEDGESYTYRIIISEDHAIHYSYVMSETRTYGITHILSTNETHDEGLINKWLWELDQRLFIKCNPDDALRHLRSAQTNIDQIIKILEIIK